ncbi:MAG TPA: sugar phosphate isomerase/epimerase [Candidatus Saccharimonadales bacterium]|nr:sugar phosphate isomerase/epimerase [Candidatus Saccharimonadales bacterium]
MKVKISASITDFPLQTSIKEFFKKFKEAGVDSVELVIGAKTLSVPHMFTLAQKYHLPITSFHQSPWSGLGFFFDEQFILKIKKYGVNTFTFHPLPFLSFDSEKMKKYFNKLSEMQKKYDITICLENMRNEPIYKKLHIAPYETMTKHLEKMYAVATHYDLSLTYDVSHTRFTHPQKHDVFKKMLPKIKNIHLSSFSGDQEHLPLDKGDFDARGFLLYLEKENYEGLITFEINYSLSKRLFTLYDFSEITRSVSVIKSLSDK